MEDITLEIVFNFKTLQWRHSGRDSVSNHRPHDCLLNRWFRRRSKRTSKLRVTGLCAGNSPGTGEFPAQMASNAENVSIWWRHHEYSRSNHVVPPHSCFVWVAAVVESIIQLRIHFCCNWFRYTQKRQGNLGMGFTNSFLVLNWEFRCSCDKYFRNFRQFYLTDLIIYAVPSTAKPPFK